MAPSEQRVFTRVPFAHALRWTSDRGESGVAAARDVCRTGIGIALGSYHRPGSILRFTFDELLYCSEPIEVDGVAVWCKPDRENLEAFIGGFSIVHGERRTLGAMSEVFYTALRHYAEAYC